MKKWKKLKKVKKLKKAEDGEMEAQPLTAEEMERKARLRCMKLLEYSDRTEMQLRRRLEEGGFPPFAVDSAIEYVRKFHYLDDRRYAENYLLQQQEKKSRRRIAQDLMQKGVEAAVVEEVMEAGEQREDAAADKLLKKHARGKDITQEKVRWSLVRYLTGKGFSYDLSRRLVEDYAASVITEAEKAQETASESGR